MKKILFRSLAACLLLFGVAGCGEPEVPAIDDTENNGENNDNPGNDNQDNENPGNEDEENPKTEEFIVQTEFTISKHKNSTIFFISILLQMFI